MDNKLLIDDFLPRNGYGVPMIRFATEGLQFIIEDYMTGEVFYTTDSGQIAFDLPLIKGRYRIRPLLRKGDSREQDHH